jgi:branched-chain amino acid transport system ATP-binding protein
MNLVEVTDLHAHYGKSHILHGVSFALGSNAILSLLGRNGSGRSTTLKAMMGIVPPTGGRVRLNGSELAGKRPHLIAREGLAFVPEERLIFPNLTVYENLVMGLQPGRPATPRWSIEDMYTYFPRLKERREQKAGNLSGGEQQMLTMCRSLLGNPRAILIDEPTEGLAPKIVDVVTDVIRDIRRRGVSVLLVEQKLTMALKVADSVIVMGHGTIVFDGTPDALQANPEIRRTWLEVS